MAMLGRRFVNIVTAGKYRSGLLSVHRLDVSKHLFYPSASEARSASETTRAQEQELPAPCAVFADATTAAAPARRRSTAFFSVVSPSSSDGSRILFTNEDGDSMMFYADGSSTTGRATHAMPRLHEFAGPVAASFSVVAQQAKEESMYVMHGVRDGVAPRFHVLRFGMPPSPMPDRWRTTGVVREGWHWQSLPPPPFVSDDDRPHAVISAYTVVEGGRTICVSSSASYGGLAGTWCFDTVRGEWWHAGDWEMPFEGRAEYLADLDLWLGISYRDPADPDSFSTYGELCTTSGLSSLSSGMTMNEPPTLLHHLWRDPHCKAKLVELINLGSGRFAIAKVFNCNEAYTSDYISYPDMDDDDQYLVVNGVEIRPRQNGNSSHIRSCSDGLELIHHKSISYECDTHRIQQVL